MREGLSRIKWTWQQDLSEVEKRVTEAIGEEGLALKGDKKLQALETLEGVYEIAMKGYRDAISERYQLDETRHKIQ